MLFRSVAVEVDAKSIDHGCYSSAESALVTMKRIGWIMYVYSSSESHSKCEEEVVRDHVKMTRNSIYMYVPIASSRDPQDHRSGGKGLAFQLRAYVARFESIIQVTQACVRQGGRGVRPIF